MSDWFERNIPEDVADRIIKLRIHIGDSVVERDFRPDLKIDYETLEEDLCTIPQQFAYWAMVYSEAKAEVAKLERISKRRRAEITGQILDEAKKENMPKIAEKVFRDLVEKDPQLLKIESTIIFANRTMGKLWNIVEALKIKSEAIRSLAGFKRQEQKNP
jgi:hypothetical protein